MLTLSIHDDGYYRNAFCALNLMSPYLLILKTPNTTKFQRTCLRVRLLAENHDSMLSTCQCYHVSCTIFFVISNEKKNEYHTVVTVKIFNEKFVERGKLVTHNTQIHDFPGLIQLLK